MRAARLRPASAVRRGARVREAAAAADDALLVVGAGVLGRLAAAEWRRARGPAARVVAQTRTTDRHGELAALGLEPVTETSETFPYVLLCAPPSGAPDGAYAGVARRAAERWGGEGGLVFTSSSAVYAEDDGGEVAETSAVVATGVSPRVDRLRAAEEAVLAAGGCVARLSGLYTAARGAHCYYLRDDVTAVDSDGGALVNQIHYADAARLCVAALQGGGRGAVYVGTDDGPLTRAAIVDAALASGRFPCAAAPAFGAGGGGGKVMTNAWTREALGWEPEWADFAAFMEAYGKGEVEL